MLLGFMEGASAVSPTHRAFLQTHRAFLRSKTRKLSFGDTEMMMFALLAASSLAAPAYLTSLEPSTAALPSGWTVVGRSSPSQPLELMFAVKQQNIDTLHDELMAVSMPKSARYGQHLSNDKVQTLTAPSPVDLAAVEAFLRAGRLEVAEATPNRDLLHIKTTVGAAEALLDARYEELEHSSSGVRIHRCIRCAFRPSHCNCVRSSGSMAHCS